LVVAVGVCVWLTVTPGVYKAEPGFGIEKLGAACVYPCPNMLVIVCCGIP
jgi:hypothetical protein